MNKAHELIKKWNEKNFIRQIIKLKIPVVWECTEDSGQWANTFVMNVPYIHTNYRGESSTRIPDMPTMKHRGLGLCKRSAITPIMC